MRAKKTKKIPLSTLLFVLLVLVGLGVLLYPTLSDLYTRYQLSREIGRYNQIAEGEKTDYTALWEQAEAYNRFLEQKESQFTVDEEERGLVNDLLNFDGSNMLGYLEIPAIQVDIPIYRGTEEKQLQSGAGWWIGSSLPTGGESTHCILTAHTGLAKAKLFTDLDKLALGDQFTITVLDRKLTYEVDQILVTEPDEAEPLYIVDGQDYVTLYTCTPYGVNTHRLLVRGHRTESIEDVTEPPLDTAPLDWLLLLAVVIEGALVILLILAVRGWRKPGKWLTAQKRKTTK